MSFIIELLRQNEKNLAVESDVQGKVEFVVKDIFQGFE